MRIKYYLPTCVSLPGDLIEEVTATADREGKSRSHLIANAIEFYLRALRDDPAALHAAEVAYGIAESPRRKEHRCNAD